jgi:hypothetical protein
MSDIVYFWGSLSIWLLLSVLVVIMRNKQKGHLLYFFLLNIIICLLISYFWFYWIATDGVSQVIGVILYLIIALVLTLVQMVIFKIREKTHKMGIPK